MNNTAFAYLDECGDCGWKLEAPYQNGGSSRFFVVGMVVGVDNSYKRFSRVIANWHKKQGYTSKKEKKWVTASPIARMNFLKILKTEVENNEKLAILAVVLTKSEIPSNIDCTKKGLQHLIYASSLVKLTENVLNQYELNRFSYCPDELNESAKLLEHILDYELTFKQRKHIHLCRKELIEPMYNGVVCADMVAGAVWESLERKNSEYIDVLEDKIKLIELF